ncbi:MAG: DUF1080 domain-containing protein [Bacteroidales bacterium]|nr:DUF1080 domain-containing protein [Bacteroidales bacterium]MBK7628966.1 DUF1080 domain-containing protein [Bacteroidales bacterium]
MKTFMINYLFPVLLFAVIACTNSDTREPMSLWKQVSGNNTPNSLSPGEAKAGWTLLFDGKTTGGWHGYNMKSFPDCWAIEDECFTMNTTGGGESLDILTNKKYRSFAFSVEYKLTSGANSGIIYQIAEDTIYKYPYETGPEVQIIDQDGWPGKLEEWQISGANYAMYTPMVKPYKPVGEWNQLLLVVDGNNVTQILNGQVVVKFVKNSEEWLKLRNSGKWTDFPDWGKYDEGYISLQNHGTKVWYRSIKIKEL